MKRLAINKKGQEGVSATAVLASIVLILLVVGILGYYFWDSIKGIFGAKENLPLQALDQIVFSCKTSASLGPAGISNYCLDFKKVSDTEYLSCQSFTVLAVLRVQDVSLLSCIGLESQIDEAKKKVCADVAKNKKDQVKVDGETCTVIELRKILPGTIITVSKGVNSAQPVTVAGFIYVVEAVNIDQTEAEIKISRTVGDVSHTEVIQKSNVDGVVYELDTDGRSGTEVIRVRIISIDTESTPNRVALEIRTLNV